MRAGCNCTAPLMLRAGFIVCATCGASVLGDLPSCYTSEDRPHRVSRRAFRERCRAGVVVGARREGKLWICSREAWHASRASAPSNPGHHVPRLLATSTDEAIAAAAIANAGLRPTRKIA